MVTATLLEPARVWLRRGHLDRNLARGVDPATDPALARRARQLSSPRCRRALAEGVHNLLDSAQRPSRAPSSTLPLARREILAERARQGSLHDALIQARAALHRA